MNREKGHCELCARNNVELTKHHLVPKEEGGTFGETAMICIPCHKQIHALYTNKELALRLSSIQDLLQDLQIMKYVKWIRKQSPSQLVKVKKSKDR